MLQEEEDEEAQTAHLAGMQVRHKGNELHEGETMILTLADRNILDEGGDLDEAADELENVLAVSFWAGFQVLYFRRTAGTSRGVAGWRVYMLQLLRQSQLQSKGGDLDEGADEQENLLTVAFLSQSLVLPAKKHC